MLNANEIRQDSKQPQKLCYSCLTDRSCRILQCS